MIDANWVVQAVEIIKQGIADRLDKDSVTIYRCGKIIRIDIKEA